MLKTDDFLDIDGTRVYLIRLSLMVNSLKGEGRLVSDCRDILYVKKMMIVLINPGKAGKITTFQHHPIGAIDFGCHIDEIRLNGRILMREIGIE